MENPRDLISSIERDSFTAGCCYVVTADGIALDVTVVNQHHQTDFKEWLRRVRSLYSQKNNKKSKIVVGIDARTSMNCVGGKRARRGEVMHLELLQICIGQHCLIFEIDPRAVVLVPRSLKAFFRHFFQDTRFMFVGVKIEDIAYQLYRDYKNTEYNTMAIIPNPVDLKELAAHRYGDEVLQLLQARNGRRCSLNMLVRHALRVDYEIPAPLAWYGEGGELSDELIMWSSVEVFFMAKLGTIFTL